MKREMRNIRAFGGAALACLALGAQAADAGLIEAKFLNPNTAPHITTSSPTVTLYKSGGGTWVANLGVMHGGAFQWDTVTNNTGLTLVDGLGTADTNDFTTFCIDLIEYIYPGNNHQFQVLTDISLAPKASSGPLQPNGMGPNAEFYIQQLWAQHFKDIFKQTTAAEQNKYASAFQLAIWKLEYDQGNIFNLTSGSLRATSSPVTTLAQGWLDLLKSESNYTGPLATLVALSGGYQDQLAEVVISNPEPGSVAIWLGIAAVGGFMRKRRNRREAE